MTQNPDQIRADIERTRSNLSTDVDALADTVNPRNVARRQVGKVSAAVGGVRDKVMGSASHAGDAAGSAASSVGDAASHAPDVARSKTQGSPLAAGLIAFGAGLVVASLLPASEKESQAAAAVKEKAEPLKQEAAAVAKDTAEQLKEPAQDAVESVKQTAQDAAATVKDEGQSAAVDVRDQAQDAGQTVRDNAQS